MDRDAHSRIDDLELRLDRYHQWLTEAISARDRLAIDAAWGVHYSLYATLALLGLLYAFDRYVGWQNWLATVGFGIAIFLVQMVVHMWSNGQRMKEVDRFAVLPEWEWKRD